jgi:hypothetical protein
MHRSCVEPFRHRACPIFCERITDDHLLSRLTLIRAPRRTSTAPLSPTLQQARFVAY